MGNLYLYDSDFELAGIPVEKRDSVLADFFLMKYEAVQDTFCASPELLYTKHFSYGEGLNSLFTMPWSELCAHPSCAGIKETTHRLFYRAMWKEPIVRNYDTYVNLPEPKALAKFREDGDDASFVTDNRTWRLWHAHWYQMHQDQIPWIEGECNALLPFVRYARDIMKAELEQHKTFYEKQREELRDEEIYKDEIEGIKKVLSQAKSNPSAITHCFHKLIMARKGSGKYAYAREIGSRILEINGYKYEEELSKREQVQVGSFRMVYSVIGREGKVQYISLDFEHGMFEFINYLNDHLGEFRFDGTLNSPPETDHAFYTV